MREKEEAEDSSSQGERRRRRGEKRRTEEGGRRGYSPRRRVSEAGEVVKVWVSSPSSMEPIPP